MWKFDEFSEKFDAFEELGGFKCKDLMKNAKILRELRKNLNFKFLNLIMKILTAKKIKMI